MKRVKIMLSAILVLAVVAGALAFKAKKTGGFCVYKTTLNEEQVLTCPKDPQLHVITPTLNGGVTISSIYTTSPLQVACPAFTDPLKCTTTLTIKPE